MPAAHCTRVPRAVGVDGVVLTMPMEVVAGLEDPRTVMLASPFRRRSSLRSIRSLRLPSVSLASHGVSPFTYVVIVSSESWRTDAWRGAWRVGHRASALQPCCAAGLRPAWWALGLLGSKTPGAGRALHA